MNDFTIAPGIFSHSNNVKTTLTNSSFLLCILTMHAIWIIGSCYSLGNPLSAAHSISNESILKGARSEISSKGIALTFSQWTLTSI